jgi:hypothetical protein
VSTVERARSLFERSPGDALDALEQFAPPHRLVDAALADLRGRHAANERARLLRERRERLRANIDWTVGRAGTLARSRIVQGSAAVLVLVVGLGIWLASRPEAPAPSTGTAAPSLTAPVTPAPTPAPIGPDPAARPPRETADRLADGARQTVDREAPASPDDGIDRRGQVRVRDLEPRTEPRPGTPAAGNAAQPSTLPPATVTERAGAAPSPAIEDRTAPAPTAGARPQPPADAGARETAPVTAPAPAPAPSPADVARDEIRQWMARYQAAYRSLNDGAVRQMNRQSNLSARLVRTASVEFIEPEIIVDPDGRSARLRAKARYEYSWRRPNMPPVSEEPINWRMTKVGDAWVANN